MGSCCNQALKLGNRLSMQSLEDPEERIGADIVMKALRAPCRAIAGMSVCWPARNWKRQLHQNVKIPRFAVITASTSWL